MRRDFASDTCEAERKRRRDLDDLGRRCRLMNRGNGSAGDDRGDRPGDEMLFHRRPLRFAQLRRFPSLIRARVSSETFLPRLAQDIASLCSFVSLRPLALGGGLAFPACRRRSRISGACIAARVASLILFLVSSETLCPLSLALVFALDSSLRTRFLLALPIFALASSVWFFPNIGLISPPSAKLYPKDRSVVLKLAINSTSRS